MAKRSKSKRPLRNNPAERLQAAIRLLPFSLIAANGKLEIRQEDEFLASLRTLNEQGFPSRRVIKLNREQLRKLYDRITILLGNIKEFPVSKDPKISRAKALDIAFDVCERMVSHSYNILAAGSLRRKCAEVGDIDFCVIPLRGKGDFLHAVKANIDPAASGDTRITANFRDRQINFLLTTKASWGAALMHITGDKTENIINRKKAKEMGFLLNEEGLFNRNTGRKITGEDEREIYEAIGKDWKSPEERNRK